MVQVTQTDDEIKIIIELNRLIIRKPDIVLLPLYIKFNNPPIFFERHLTDEIDDVASFCRIFKNEARIILIKKKKGIWMELFKKLSKEELQTRRLEISNQVVERNKEREQQAIERYENKRRAEIEKEVKRESAIRDRIKQFEETACRETMMVGTRKEAHPPNQKNVAIANVRNSGKINVSFSTFSFTTPKRESQEGLNRSSKFEDLNQPQ